MAQVVTNLPAMQEMQEKWVQFLGGEDTLEEEMALHSSILAWKIQWTESGGLLLLLLLSRFSHVRLYATP